MYFDIGKMGRYQSGMNATEEQAKTYHHGDLRRSLLRAAESELAEGGVESFSLRKVAKRAGVSHAAPAHHFGDVTGLLTALTKEGYMRFADALRDGANRGGMPRDRLIEMGLSYVHFALHNTAIFRLIFSSERPDFNDPGLADAANDAFMVLADEIADLTGAHPFQDDSAMSLAGALWSVVHGAGDLIASGRMGTVGSLPPQARDQQIRCMIERVLPPS